MRFLIFGLNYLPESTSIGPYTAELAQYLKKSGHKVKVITGFPIAPQWEIWSDYRGKWFMREIVNEVPILRTFLYVSSQPKKAFNRILFDTSFTLSSLIGGLSIGQIDLIVVVSPPLQLGLTGWLLGLAKRAPFFLHIQDLVPEVAVATGMLPKDSPVVRLAQSMERFVYSRAKAIGVISDGFARNLIKKGVAPEKIMFLPNYIDVQFFMTNEENRSFRRRHNIAASEFLVMYSGSIALKQDLETFVEAAAAFAPGDAVTFYLVGEGPYLQELKEFADELKLKNLHFLPLQPRENLPDQLKAADALVITQQRKVAQTVFPSKLLYYMAAGRPVIAAVSPDSDIGRFIKEYQVGLVIPPEEPMALAKAIKFLRQNRHEAIRLGRNGRIVVEEKFDREMVLAQFKKRLEKLVESA